MLNNWTKHDEHRATFAVHWTIDPFSSAISFDGWKDRDESIAPPPTYERLPVHRPKSWLLNVGWRRYGLVSTRETPSAKLAE